MSAQPLRALIWKDMRLNRLILLFCGAAILLACLYTIGVWVHLQRLGEPFRTRMVVYEHGIVMVMTIAALATALLGANAAAAEYADRSASFLAYLPPRRQFVLLSRVICGLAPSLALAAISLVAIFFHDLPVWQGLSFHDIVLVLGTSWILFAGAWCLGTISRSLAIGGCGGIALPIFLGMAILNFEESRFRSPDWPFWKLFSLAEVVIGTVLFIVATIILLRRSET